MKTVSTMKKNKIISILFTLTMFIAAGALSQPLASFNASIVEGCSPILVNFTDQSTGNPTSWKWDLGNGTTSVLQNPSATYFSPGQYTIKLVVSNATGQDSLIKVNYIKVQGAPLVNFSSSASSGCLPVTIDFTDESISSFGNIVSWNWDLGDGVLSTVQNPSFTYTRVGSYNVSLKVTNSLGCIATLQRNSFISASGVIADFSSSISNVCTSNLIIFRSASTGNGTLTYNWLFADSSTSNLANPLHTYAKGGNYLVKQIVSNQFGCKDSVTKDIRVGWGVSPAFSSSSTVSCKSPFNVSFTSQAAPGNTYYWNFGDSTQFTGPNPTHQYIDTGFYTVKLIVVNQQSCVDSLKKINYIRIKVPSLNIINLPDSGCSPFTKSFSNSPLPGSESLTSISWDFGDGGTSSNPSPNHTFTGNRYYNIRVTGVSSSGCRDTVLIPNAIKTSFKPVSNFRAATRSTCGMIGIQFTDLSTGNPTQWMWDFGDNTTSNERNPKHVFKDTGFMTIKLIAFNGGCSDTATFINYVYIKPAIAKFTVSGDCKNPLTKTFINNSIGEDIISWDFGDGTTSTADTVVHTFAQSGEYTVTLWAKNNTTGCDYTLTKVVKVLKTNINFYSSDTIVCRGSTVSFSYVSDTSAIYNYSWTFGNGPVQRTSSKVINHRFDSSAIYSIRLITNNKVNCRDTLVKAMYIKVNGPIAKFRTDNLGNCITNKIIFNDVSTGDRRNALQSWKWDYGDSVVETVTSPPFEHFYARTGSYYVKLKVTDVSGCSDSFKLQQPVIISRPSASFLGYDPISCPNANVRFVSMPAAPAGFFYKWDFGNGKKDSIERPTTTYAAPGLYTVRLIITNNRECADTSIRTNFIRIVKPIAKFSINDSFKICPPLIVNFKDSSTGVLTRMWDFGDGTSTNSNNPSHFYNYPGIYIAKLTVTSEGGCTSVMEKRITVEGPRGTLSYIPLAMCKPYIVNFKAQTTGAVSYTWDFNDGNTTINSDSVISHTYLNAGFYRPKIILEDNIGCRVPVLGVQTIHAVNLVAALKFPSIIACDSNTVKFTNLSYGSEVFTNYQWDFGDGNFSGTKNPVHTYASQGLYFPKLIITTLSGCKDSITSITPVKIANKPVVNFTTTASGCAPINTIITSQLSPAEINPVTWDWNFGNGTSSSLQNPSPQNYTTPGIYNITLTATSSNGCKKVITKTIEAYRIPVVRVSGDDTICKGKQAALHATGGSSYSWSSPSTLSCVNCADPIATPLEDTRYTVSTISVNGCNGRDSMLVKVNQPARLRYSNSANACRGTGVRLSASGAKTYNWSPPTGLSNANIASPMANPGSDITYRVIGTDENQCGTDTGFVIVRMAELPTVDAGEDKTILAGRPVDLDPVMSSDVVEVDWSPTDGLFRNSLGSITVKPTQNTEYTVEVKNRSGCLARDRVIVNVACNKNNVFIPNTFSPNDNGINEVFFVRGTGLLKIRTMNIFNRWGQQVFSKKDLVANDPTQGWDGTFKGARLGADVYIYMIEIECSNGTLLPYRGNIALVR